MVQFSLFGLLKGAALFEGVNLGINLLTDYFMDTGEERKTKAQLDLLKESRKYQEYTAKSAASIIGQQEKRAEYFQNLRAQAGMSFMSAAQDLQLPGRLEGMHPEMQSLNPATGVSPEMVREATDDPAHAAATRNVTSLIELLGPSYAHAQSSRIVAQMMKGDMPNGTA